MSVRTRINQAIIAFSLFAAGGVAVWYLAVPHGSRVFTDGTETIDEQIWLGSRRVVWEQPALLEQISTAEEESGVSVSPDGMSIYYTVGEEGGLCDLWVARLNESGDIVARRPLDGINTPYDDRDPFVTEDALFFASNRPGSRGGFDLFIARREGDGFGVAEPLGTSVNSLENERRPVLDAAGETLLFASDRTDPGALGGYDLYRAERAHPSLGRGDVSSGSGGTGRRFKDAIPLIQLNSPADDLDPCLWPDGTRVVFSSNRKGGQGGFDFWVTVWAKDQWLAPEPLHELNTVDDERSPSASAGGFSMVFASERPWGAGLSDLYRVGSRELFPLPGERGIADIIAQILLVLLLLLALFAFLANRWKQLDIVVKCLLLSILLHLFLLLWFRTVELTGALDERSSRGKSYKIRFVPKAASPTEPQANAVRGDQLAPTERELAHQAALARENVSLEQIVTERSVSTTDSLAAQAPDAESLNERSQSRQSATASPAEQAEQRLAVAEHERYRETDPGRSIESSEMVASRTSSRELQADTHRTELAVAEPVRRARAAAVEQPARSVSSDIPTRQSDSWELAKSQALVADDVRPLEITFEKSIYNAADPMVDRPESRSLEVERVAEADGGPAREQVVDLGSVGEPERVDDLDAELPSSVELAIAGLAPRDVSTPRENHQNTVVDLDVRPLEIVLDVPATIAVSAPDEAATTPELLVQEFLLEESRSSLEPVVVSVDRMPLSFVALSPLESTRSREISLTSGLPTLDLTVPLAGRRASTPARLELTRRDHPTLSREPMTTASQLAERSVSLEEDPERSLLIARIRSKELAKLDVFEASRGAFDLAFPEQLARVAGVALDRLVPRATTGSRRESPKLEGLYSGRTEAGKRLALREYGGSEESEQAVQSGLAYLARTQRADGSWGRANHEDSKYGHVRVGKTGLSLLAFLASGHTQFSETKYTRNVRQAIGFLLDRQDPATGHFGVTSSYSHGISTYALAESYAMTRDPKLKEPLIYAVAWILFNQYLDVDDRQWVGGWGYYYPDGRFVADKWPRASVTAWQVMALKSAKIGGLDIPDRHLSAARAYLRNSFDYRGGYFRYTHDPDRLRSPWPYLPASTPASIFALLLLGEDGEDAKIQKATQFVLDRTPRGYRRASDDDFVLEGQGNLYFWYYSTLAMFLKGGDEWKVWNAAVRDMLVLAQNDDGSWTPISPYSRYADESSRDRTYTTAMNVLTLEIYYRYFPPLLRQGR